MKNLPKISIDTIQSFSHDLGFKKIDKKSKADKIMCDLNNINYNDSNYFIKLNKILYDSVNELKKTNPLLSFYIDELLGDTIPKLCEDHKLNFKVKEELQDLLLINICVVLKMLDRQIESDKLNKLIKN